MINAIVKKIRTAGANWKTTAAGIAAVLIGVGDFIKLIFGDAEVSFADVQVRWEAIAMGVGLILARDSDKSSEASGAK